MATKADRAPDINYAGSDSSMAAELAALKDEVAQLKDMHVRDMRRLEIAFLKSEFALVVKLRQLNAGSEAVAPRTEHLRTMSYDERSPIERLLFRKSGRPKKVLRLLLFAPSGRPRSLTWRFVFHSDGRPRRRYVEWMKSDDYRRLPMAHRI